MLTLFKSAYEKPDYWAQVLAFHAAMQEILVAESHFLLFIRLVFKGLFLGHLDSNAIDYECTNTPNQSRNLTVDFGEKIYPRPAWL